MRESFVHGLCELLSGGMIASDQQFPRSLRSLAKMRILSKVLLESMNVNDGHHNVTVVPTNPFIHSFSITTIQVNEDT